MHDSITCIYTHADADDGDDDDAISHMEAIGILLDDDGTAITTAIVTLLLLCCCFSFCY